MISRTTLLIVALPGLVLITGCSPYVDGFYYAPHPAVAEIQTATTQPSQGAPPPVTAYATVVGVRRENRDQHIPLSIEVRLRIDNNGPRPVAFDPRTLDLTTGALVGFLPPIVQPPQTVSILPGQPLTVQADFPFPPGGYADGIGIDTLQLRWTVQIDGQFVPQFAGFHRIHRYYYDPYWDYPPYSYGYPYVGFGGTVIIRR